MARKRKRSGLSPSLRFEVFKRDSFTCQYCGRAAPTVVLQCDHIDPHSKGGADDILNLVTSCSDCNAGKGDRTLGEQTVLAKQRAQLEELQERRSQLEMLLQWKQGLQEFKNEELSTFQAEFARYTGWHIARPLTVKRARSMLKKHGLSRVLDALAEAVETHLPDMPDGGVSQAGAEKVWETLTWYLKPKEERALYYARGILRKRFDDVDEIEALDLLRAAATAGYTSDWLQDNARLAPSYQDWADDMRTRLYGGR